MSHEQSDTIQGRDQRWYNVYGAPTGAPQPMPLPQVFGFERPSYSTEAEASNKAAWRSHMGEGQYPTQAPQYGFSNTYQPSPQADLFGSIIEALRNPWQRGPQGPGSAESGYPMILGPGLGFGMAKGPHMDPGGFSVPVRKILRDQPGLKSLLGPQMPLAPGSLGKEISALQKFGFNAEEANQIANTRLPGPKEMFVDSVADTNEMVRKLATPNPSESLRWDQSMIRETMDAFPEINKDIKDVNTGLENLAHEIRRQQNPMLGGSQPLPSVLEDALKRQGTLGSKARPNTRGRRPPEQ